MPNSNFVFDPQLFANQIAEQNLAINKAYAESKKDLSSSQMTYTLQIPEEILESSLESIGRELEERASALSEISRLLEVVGETDSLILHHLSTLRMAASRSERKRSKKLPQYSVVSEPEPSVVYSLQTATAQSVVAEGWIVGQPPLPVGQG